MYYHVCGLFVDNFSHNPSAVEALWNQHKKIFTCGVDKFVWAALQSLFCNDLTVQN